MTAICSSKLLVLFEGGGGHFRLDLANLLLDALSHTDGGSAMRTEPRAASGLLPKPLGSIRIGFPSD
jgi:hypothetical protein